MGLDPNQGYGIGNQSSADNIGDQWGAGQAGQTPGPSWYTSGSSIDSVSDRNIIISVKNSDKFQAIYNGGNIASQVSGGQVYIRSSIIDTANISVLAAEEILLNGNTDGTIAAGDSSTVDNSVGTGGGTTGNTGGAGTVTGDTDFLGYLSSPSETYMFANPSNPSVSPAGGGSTNLLWSNMSTLNFSNGNQAGGPAPLSNLTNAYGDGYRVPSGGAGDYQLVVKVRLRTSKMWFHKALSVDGKSITADKLVLRIGVNDLVYPSPGEIYEKVGTQASATSNYNSSAPINWIYGYGNLVEGLFKDSNQVEKNVDVDIETTQILTLGVGDIVTIKIGHVCGWQHVAQDSSTLTTSDKPWSWTMLRSNAAFTQVPVKALFSNSSLEITKL